MHDLSCPETDVGFPTFALDDFSDEPKVLVLVVDDLARFGLGDARSAVR